MNKSYLLSSVFRAPEGGEGGGGGDGGAAAAAAALAAKGAAPQGIKFDHLAEPIRTKLTGRGITPDQAGIDRLVTSFDAADRYLNGAKDLVPVPGDKATPDDWNKLYTTLGRPEKPDNYQFNLAQGVTADPSFKGFAQNLMFEMGVPAARAQGVVDAYQKYVGERQAADITAGNNEIAALKAERGAAFDQDLARGKQVYQTLGLSPEHVSKIEAILAEPGKNVGAAAVMKLFIELGKRVAEGSFKVGGGGGGSNDPASLSPEQATAKIAANEGDTAFQKKYHDKNHPEHAAAVKEMEVLFAAKHRKAAA